MKEKFIFRTQDFFRKLSAVRYQHKKNTLFIRLLGGYQGRTDRNGKGEVGQGRIHRLKKGRTNLVWIYQETKQAFPSRS